MVWVFVDLTVDMRKPNKTFFPKHLVFNDITIVTFREVLYDDKNTVRIVTCVSANYSSAVTFPGIVSVFLKYSLKKKKPCWDDVGICFCSTGFS